MRHLRAISLVVLVAMLLPVAAFASDVSTALYSGTVTISNNSTAKTNVTTVFTANTTAMVAAGFMNSSANNTAMQTSSGADVAYMPGYTPGGYPWVVFVPAIGANTQTADILYTGGTANMNGKIRIFTDSGGMTIGDDPTMELTDNGSVSLKAFVDTSVSGNLSSKFGAFSVVNDSGDIDANLFDYKEQNTRTSSSNMYAGLNTRIGQRFDTYPVGYIDTVVLSLSKSGAPAGTVTVNVRKVSDDSVIGTSGTISTANITTSFALYEFTSDVYNATTQNIRISAEYGGGGAADYIKVGWHTTAAPTGVFTYYNAGWTDDAAKDATYRVATIINTVTATGVSSGEKTINAGIESPFFGLAIDTDLDLPVVTNLTLNAPLPQLEVSSSPFTTIDSNALTGTVTGATWSTSGYSFDGINDKILFADNPLFDFGSTVDFTLNIWLNPNADASNYRAIIDKQLNAPNYEGYSLRLDQTTGFLRFIMTDTAATSIEVADAVNHFGGGWFMATVSIDRNVATGIQLYVNGLPVNSGNPTTVGDMDNANDLRLGLWRDDASLPYWGALGDFQLYRGKALTPTEVLQSYNAQKTRYGVSGDIYTYSTLESIPNTDYDLRVGGDVTPYIEYYKHYVNGGLVSDIAWEYGTTFTDASLNGNDATPSFRTASSSAYVSASLTGFTPIEEAKAPAYVLSSVPTFFTTAPGMTSAFTSNITGAAYPGHDVIVAITTAGGIPEQFLTYILTAVVLILVFGLSAGWFLAKYARGDTTLVLATVIFAAMCIGAALKVIDVWQIYFFVIMAWGIRELEKDARGLG